MNKFLSISDLSIKLNLINRKTKKPLNHVLRYWEKEFREIRPKKINNRRYYSGEQVELIEMIKFLLKNKGLTISGVKELMKNDVNKLDVTNFNSLKAEYYKKSLKAKSKKLLKKIRELKRYGKKNSS